MNFNFKEIATATMVLFAVIDIIGSIPVIIGLRAKAGQHGWFELGRWVRIRCGAAQPDRRAVPEGNEGS